MRVWALASCGGLLALAACSADQSNTTNPNSPPPDGNALTQGKTSPASATPRPLARPEMPPQQTLSARPRLNPAAVSGEADRTPAQPQSDQLRARLQRLRAQQGARLASNTPVAAAPIPTVIASPIPQPEAPTLRPVASNPGASRDPGARGDSRLTIVPQPNRAEQSLLAVALPPQPSPQPPVIEADVEPSGTTADLQPVVAATVANNYPIAPLRHQGHSVRQSARQSVRSAPQVLVPLSASQPVAAGARLHGSTAPALAAQPRGSSTASVSEAEATVVPDSTPAAADLRARASDAAIPREHVASQPRAGSPVTLTHPGDFPSTSPAEGAHQQESTAPLRSAERLPLQASLAPRPDSRTTGDQGLGAITLPESLPLNSAAPRLSPQRPQLSPAQPTVSLPTATSSAASRSVVTNATDRATTEPTAAPFAVPSGGHLSPTDQDGFHLVPSVSQSPKGLPLTHCPPASAHTPTADRLGDGAIAPQPSFSGRNQSMTLVKDAPLAHCWSNALTQSVALESNSAAAPAPHSLDFPAAEAVDLDLETLAPVPASD